MTLKLLRFSWISALIPPTAWALSALRRLTQPETSCVRTVATKAGAKAAAPNRGLMLRKKMAAPIITKMLPTKRMMISEKNWFSLSVSLLMREMRSPALFAWKNPIGRACSLLKIALRRRKSVRCPTPPMTIIWT